MEALQSVLVLGLGVSGQAATAFLLNKGVTVTAMDSRAERLRVTPEVEALLGKGLDLLDESQDLHVSDFDALVVSPGVAPSHPTYQAALESQTPVMGEVDLALRNVKQRVVGVTGTNGKTTVTSLIAHALNYNGMRAHALGNIGVPITSQLDSGAIGEDDILVVELSSYQLETLRAPCLDVALILNISPDHLDRYPNMDAYAEAKFQILNCMKPSGLVYLDQKTYTDHASKLDFRKVKTFGLNSNADLWLGEDGTFHQESRQENHKENIDSFLPLRYRGKKNFEVFNCFAAYLSCRELGLSWEAFWESVDLFEKPSHRLEFVRELNGVSYYDDSKGTNLGAVEVAVESMPGKVVLIAGGQHKGAPYTPWLSMFASKVRAVCAIGEAKKQLEEDLGATVPVTCFSSLGEAIESARELAQEGDAVLLSPGCASFDMFDDYRHRGKVFQQLVQALGGEESK